MRLLLDTCTFLWIASGASALSHRARDLFSDPENDVALSSVSAWEIVVKHRLGKLPLPSSPSRFVTEQRSSHRIAELPLVEGAVLAVEKLPDVHRDPFDRMLVAQAIFHGLVVVTPDSLIHQYPVRCAW